MPKKSENLEAAEELTVQPELPVAETEETDEQTAAISVPVAEIPEEIPTEDVETPKPKRTRRK